MTLPTAPDNDLLDRYLANECAPAEREYVELWAACQGRALRFSALRRAAADPFGSVQFGPFEQLHQRLWQAVAEVERQEQPVALMTAKVSKGAPPRRGEVKPWSRTRSVWSTVGGVALAVMVILAGWRAVAFRTGGHRSVAVATYITANGERATITLPDGSTAALDVASRLDVPADYATGDRTLRLTGKALFTVLHHKGAPFTVVAGSTTTRVLGTSFVVRHYATDSITTIAVRDGKVAVRSRVLAANQQLEVGPAGVLRMHPAEASQFSFAIGVLTLDGLLLSDAIPELDRWYNADIRLGDPTLGSQRLTGDVPAGSLAELASLLEWTFNMRVVREGRVLTLFPR